MSHRPSRDDHADPWSLRTRVTPREYISTRGSQYARFAPHVLDMAGDKKVCRNRRIELAKAPRIASAAYENAAESSHRPARSAPFARRAILDRV